jgi:hypothetical protein
MIPSILRRRERGVKKSKEKPFSSPGVFREFSNSFFLREAVFVDGPLLCKDESFLFFAIILLYDLRGEIFFS